VAQVCWYLGYLMAVVTGYALMEWGGVHWRWVLASAAVPAAIGLLLRHGVRNRPAGLLAKGDTQRLATSPSHTSASISTTARNSAPKAT